MFTNENLMFNIDEYTINEFLENNEICVMPIIWLFGGTLHKLGITDFLENSMMVAHVYTIAKLILHPMVSKQVSKQARRQGVSKPWPPGKCPLGGELYSSQSMKQNVIMNLNICKITRWRSCQGGASWDNCRSHHGNVLGGGGGEGTSRMSEYCQTHYDIMYISYLALVRSRACFTCFIW
jgi:hypothetical protein